MKDQKKMRGGFYTPSFISDFITEWAIRRPSDTILEPSCGDGNFIKSILHKFNDFDLKENIIAIELDKEEAEKAKQKYGIKINCDDFFSFYEKNIYGQKQFDVVVGNPPFIRYQDIPKACKEKANLLIEKNGFQINNLANLWLMFLLISCKALKEDGRIGMVIPKELFQVSYASKAREFLMSYFSSVSIISFQNPVFEEIQQDIVLLLGEKGKEKRGIRFFDFYDEKDLKEHWEKQNRETDFKQIQASEEKWTQYSLSQEEQNLLDKLKHDSKISNALDLFEVNVGIVSGANEFFVINQKTVRENRLQKSVVPILSKGSQIKGICFRKSDLEESIKENKNVFLFSLPNKDFRELSKEEQNYLKYGESKEYDKRYKCRIRPRWYYIKPSWKPEAFLMRHIHLYPKMVLNEANVISTDAVLKIKFKKFVDKESVICAFINSYTLALSEIIGRSYGGGVLELVPNEVRQLRIPMVNAEKLNLLQIDKWQREGEIEKILNYTDFILLKQGLGLTDTEILSLRNIWKKLKDKRLCQPPRPKEVRA